MSYFRKHWDAQRIGSAIEAAALAGGHNPMQLRAIGVRAFAEVMREAAEQARAAKAIEKARGRK